MNIKYSTSTQNDLPTVHAAGAIFVWNASNWSSWDMGGGDVRESLTQRNESSSENTASPGVK